VANHLINISNEFMISLGSTPPDHKVIAPLRVPRFRTRQQAYRCAAWIVAMAEVLPNETDDDTFLDILDAIKNT